MPVDPDPAPLVPAHLADWYPGDLADARAAHDSHVPSGLPAHRAPAPRAASGPERAPSEGGRFLAAWYAGDVDAAARAVHEHGSDDTDGTDGAPVVRLGRTAG